MELEYRRKLPPELLVEMHKCLPLANQIYVLVNVSKTFLLNNSTRMHRNIQRIQRLRTVYIFKFFSKNFMDDKNSIKNSNFINKFNIKI